jgi:hypothetical protein
MVMEIVFQAVATQAVDGTWSVNTSVNSVLSGLTFTLSQKGPIIRDFVAFVRKVVDVPADL